MRHHNKGRRTDKDVIQEMKRKLTQLQSQAGELEADHAQVVLKHALLSAIVDALGQLRAHQQQLLGGDSACGLASSREGSDAERELLEQLQLTEPQHQASPSQATTCPSAGLGEPGSSGSTQPAADPVQRSSGDGEHSIAPEGHPLWLFGHLLRQPRPTFLSNPQLGMDEVNAAFRAGASELALQLAQAQCGMPADSGDESAAQQRIEALVSQLLGLMVHLGYHRMSYLWQLAVNNQETGQVQPDHDLLLARTRMALAQLHVTPDQQRRVASGMPLFQALVSNVQQELRDQQAASTAASEAMSAALGASSASPAQRTGSTQLAELLARDRQQEEARQQRLKVLLRKDLHCRLMLGGFVYGCLTWRQMAQLFVLLSPYMPVPALVATAICGTKAGAAEAAAEGCVGVQAAPSPAHSRSAVVSRAGEEQMPAE